MKRREFVSGVGLGAATVGLSACGSAVNECAPGENSDSQTFKLKMVTTWPPNFPGLGSSASQLGQYIEAASAGRIKVQVYAANELVPAFEVFDAVSSGTADMGHGAAYYWRNKKEILQLFATVPFGLNAAEMNGWLYKGGGLELWREAYKPFGLVPFAAGNTGAQMGGWFNKPINGLADLKNLKMRIPGIGGEALEALGGTPVAIPGGDIFTSMQTGVIDATEWVGPYNDIAFGLHKVAKYYYYPGWQEPGPTLECMFNQKVWDALPDDLQKIVEISAQAVNTDMLAEYSFRNAAAYEQLLADPNVEILPFPTDVLEALREQTEVILERIAKTDEFSQRVWDSYKRYRDSSRKFQSMAEGSMLANRG